VLTLPCINNAGTENPNLIANATAQTLGRFLKTRYKSIHAALAASQVRGSRRPAGEIVGTELVTVGSASHALALVVFLRRRPKQAHKKFETALHIIAHVPGMH
jgi:hypothetical protein